MYTLGGIHLPANFQTSRPSYTLASEGDRGTNCSRPLVFGVLRPRSKQVTAKRRVPPLKLPIKVINREFQGEEHLDDERIAELAAALESGIALPPVVVRYDGETYWLQDGFHRIAAMVSIGCEETEAEIIPGTLADIQSDFDQMIREMRGKW